MAGIGILVLLAAIAFWRTEKPATPNGESGTHSSRGASSTPSSLVATSVLKKSESVGEQSQKPEKTLEEILETDDVCLLNKKIVSDKVFYEQASRVYFERSEFHDRYQDYQALLSGRRPNVDARTRFSFHMAQAGFLMKSGHEIVSIALNQELARQGFAEMAALDPENSIFSIASLATKNLNPQLKDEFIARVLRSQKFDSYTIEYARDLASVDTLTATATILKIGHLAGFPVVDWMGVRDQLKINLKDHPEVLEKIGQLMVSQGLESKRPSRELGYPLLEYAVGRSLLKNFKVPNYKDLNAILSGNTSDEDGTLFYELADGCSEETAQKIRSYYSNLRQNNIGFNLDL